MSRAHAPTLFGRITIEAVAVGVLLGAIALGVVWIGKKIDRLGACGLEAAERLRVQTEEAAAKLAVGLRTLAEADAKIADLEIHLRQLIHDAPSRGRTAR